MDETTTRYVLDGLTWYLVFIVSTSFHEAAHAWAALWGGDPTAHRAGQTTLNPVPHIRRAPVGMVVVPILSFIMTKGGWMMGWASAPYDPYWALRHPRRAALMSLAGPAANFLLAGVAFAAIKIGLGAGFFEQPASAGFSRVVTGEGFASGAATLVSVLLMLNVILGIFNLLPAPPLDGHAVVPLFLSRESGLRWLEGARGFGMMGIVLAWVVFGRIFGPIFTFVLELIYPGTSWG